MADAATITVLWARRVKLGSSQTGGIEVHVQVTNSGDVSWSAGARKIRGHVAINSGPNTGLFFRDPAVSGSTIEGAVAPTGSVTQSVIFQSAGFTPTLQMQDLMRGDTLLIVDVVNEGVGWIGNPCASFYVKDANGPG